MRTTDTTGEVRDGICCEPRVRRRLSGWPRGRRSGGAQLLSCEL